MTLSISYVEIKDPKNSYNAISNTLNTAKIDEIYWFSNKPFDFDPGIPVHWTYIDPPTEEQNWDLWYNTVHLKVIPQAVQSDYNLLIHPDGYPVNAEAYTDEFLNYDYIGAPWMHHPENQRVGNGGFSWRSKRLYQALNDWQPSWAYPDWPNHTQYATQRQPGNPQFPEDHCISVLFRPHLEQHYGIKFAPSELAHQFSFELYSSDNNSPWRGRSWGFHGHHTAQLYGQQL